VKTSNKPRRKPEIPHSKTTVDEQRRNYLKTQIELVTETMCYLPHTGVYNEEFKQQATGSNVRHNFYCLYGRAVQVGENSSREAAIKQYANFDFLHTCAFKTYVFLGHDAASLDSRSPEFPEM
jgi:hypothetical protein